LQHEYNFIFVCKPDSHPKLYERLAFWQTNDGLTELESRHWNGRYPEVTQYRYINNVLLRQQFPEESKPQYSSRYPVWLFVNISAIMSPSSEPFRSLHVGGCDGDTCSHRA